MIRRFVEWVAAWCERHGRVFNITGTGGHDDVYLTRYYVFKSRWFNIFIHRFMRSDRDDLHDHPWDFCTYLVSGAYTETKWEECRGFMEGPGTVDTRRVNTSGHVERLGWLMGSKGNGNNKQNRLVFRRAEDQHKVAVDRPYQKGEEALAPLTVCVTGPQRREWGFWKTARRGPELKADGTLEPRDPLRVWIPWREYLGLDKDAPSRG